MDRYLPETQQILLRQLGPEMQTLGFYLAGGTALAIYYQHRLSVALDWFTQYPIGDSMLLASKLQDKLALTITDACPDRQGAPQFPGVSLSFAEACDDFT